MLLPWVSALCYGGTGPYVAVRLREQGETMLTGDEVYYGVGPCLPPFIWRPGRDGLSRPSGAAARGSSTLGTFP